jgi:2-polyprenyl-6-methoxyphenol hydroxylase-like FAD-dependent oxidoreductase
MSNNSVHNVDVVVVGLGPAGLLSSILLGQKGYNVIALDRWPQPYPLPRAVTFDNEIARILASLGINPDDDPSIDYHEDRYLWLNKDGETLMEVDWKSKAADGWRNRYWFSQPELEERMREIISSLPTVQMWAGMEVDSLTQDAESISVTYHEVRAEGTSTVAVENGKTGTINAKFTIGADGANSFVRRAVGYEFTDLQFYYDWVVVDTTPAVMPPMDRAPYVTSHFQICDPARPTTVVPGGPGRRRWEFMVLPGEDPQDIARAENVWKLLEPFGMDPAKDKLDRSVAWRFQGKFLENWRAGRAVMLGDAAHLMPPFAGEGMCAAFRDVYNLMWRLDLYLQGHATEELLDEWSNERRVGAKWYIDFSVNLGRVICITDEAEAAERDAKLMADYKANPHPVSAHEAVLGDGTWDAQCAIAGKPSRQGRIAYKGRTGRFDDVVGRGWFVLHKPGASAHLSSTQLEEFTAIGGQVLSVGPRGTGADVVDVEGAYAAWFADAGADYILIRPDFYVAGSANTEAELQGLFDKVLQHVLVA